MANETKILPAEKAGLNQAVTWHSEELSRILRKLKTDKDRGLTADEVQARQLSFGKNVLPRGKKTSLLTMFFRQFASPLVYILIIAAALTWWIKEYADMTVIVMVVIVNAIIGLFQEYRANKIFEKLKAIVRVEALTIREGKLVTVDSEELVPGDIIVLKGGNKVPADARLVTASNLEANEALLTGESKPTNKSPGTLAKKTVIGDRANMVFMGTVLEEGDGRAVVAATGGRTEIGQISLLAQSTADEESPLQQRMKKLARFLTELFVVISGAVFILGLIEGDSPIEMFKTTIAVAVAAIPEGLPAAISIILAVSSKRILEKKGLVMKLLAAETLGSTSVICADKTGTLTLGQMRVEEIIASDKEQALLAMALANEAVIEEKDGKIRVKGEATDKAKLETFLASGKNLEEILRALPRLAILGFDPVRKFMASFHESKKGITAYISGAPEKILELSTLKAGEKEAIKKNYENFARRGFRVIALASKSISSPSRGEDWVGIKPANLEKFITNITYLGLAAIRDPVRPDVRQTLVLTRKAGIKVVMITGDHVLTAKAIGLELGFKTSGSAALSGEEIDKLSDSQLRQKIGEIEIISRAAPIHKMRIIDAWQSLGAVVAMTGDGVNDAPALKSADIGVAIGSGTDVSKEASDLILLDDSFSTITAAVAEGRTGFANIRKATITVMSNAFTELILITGALILKTPFFPITAIQILWVNLIEDSLPVLAMAFEPQETEIMKSRPTSPKEPILDRESKSLIFAVSILADLILVGIFYSLYKYLGWEEIKIQSFLFVAIATPTLLNVFAFKSLRTPITKINLFNNPFLVVSVLIGIMLMIAAIYVPFLNRFLKTTPLDFWPAVISFALFPLFKLLMVELTKWRYRSKNAIMILK